MKKVEKWPFGWTRLNFSGFATFSRSICRHFFQGLAKSREKGVKDPEIKLPFRQRTDIPKGWSSSLHEIGSRSLRESIPGRVKGLGGILRMRKSP